jgi:hypothetical protein
MTHRFLRVKPAPSSLKLNERDMDEKISNLFEEWLSAFDAVQLASEEEAITRAQNRLSEIETQIANAPARAWSAWPSSSVCIVS